MTSKIEGRGLRGAMADAVTKQQRYQYIQSYIVHIVSLVEEIGR
jgi:hypothetical protein